MYVHVLWVSGGVASIVTVSYVQVELVLTFEELLPTKLRRRFVTGRKEVYPNKKPSIKKRLQHLFWAGEPYDTRTSINSALRPTLVSQQHVNESAINQFISFHTILQDANKDIQRKTNLLIRDVDDVKQGLSLLQVCHSNDQCSEVVCDTVLLCVTGSKQRITTETNTCDQRSS